MNNSTVRFSASCIKTLSAVEVKKKISNQHEFNGVSELKKIFGLCNFKKIATFSIRGETTRCTANITWYEAREAHPTRSEYRLYFTENIVMQQAEEGDNVIIGFESTGEIHIILIKNSLFPYQEKTYEWKIE